MKAKSKSVAPPYPACEVGPKGPVPLTDLPVRDAPKGAHQCEGFPGGPLTDTSKLIERDHFAKCFIDCCRRQRNSSDPQLSKLVGPDEWAFFVQQLRDRGLIDEKDVSLLNDMPGDIDSGINIR